MYNDSGKHRLLFFLRVILPAILAFTLFAGLIFGYMIPGFEKAMLERKREMIRELTHSAWSICEDYHRQQLAGTLTAGQARLQAIATIRAIRYGEDNKDYFWITDLAPVMVMHPYRPDLDGKDLSRIRDPLGKAMFVEFVRTATSGKGGYVDYMWQWKDEAGRIVPKLSYVKLFKPWDWVIGTGIYIEDVKAEIRRIETETLLISGSICLFIIILLVIMTRQSHRIEKGRRLAEQEVMESRERYRALAEAASEGVLIWSDQGLHANKTMLAWLDFEEEEIRRLSLPEIAGIAALNGQEGPASLYDEFSVRQHTECELKGNNNRSIRVHADLSSMLLGDHKAVMLVARPASSPLPGKINVNPLYDSLGVGFFTTTFSRKNRFTYVSLTTRRLLGLYPGEDIGQYSIESFFADPAERKAFLREMSEKNRVLERLIRIRRKEGDEQFVIVSALVREDHTGERYCEGCIEPLTASGTVGHLIPPGQKAYGLPALLQVPVSTLAKEAVTCRQDDPVDSVIPALRSAGRRHLLVTTSEGSPLGILDAANLAFHLASGASPETPAFRWMTSPPVVVPASLSLAEALPLLWQSDCGCLVAENTDDPAFGLLTCHDVVTAFDHLPEYLETLIGSAATVTALKQAFLLAREMCAWLLEGKADPFTVSRFNAGIADRICRRAVELALASAGEPPVPFAFIQLGSAGRKEQSLRTDQDNAIIFRDVSPAELPTVKNYFLKLGIRINNLLDKAGYSLCQGGMMAGNERWCQPLDTWKSYFSRWARNPGPEELLEISVFYDFDLTYGEVTLVEELRQHVMEGIHTNDIFFHLMAQSWMPFDPEKQYHPEGISNLKTMLMPLTGLVRLYALATGSKALSTLERAFDVNRSGSFDRNLLQAVVTAWNTLTEARLKHQVRQILQGLPPDNQPDLQSLDEPGRTRIARAVEDIRLLMQKAEVDYLARRL